jgi:hypothetical protein
VRATSALRWAVPVALAGLAVAVLVAVLVARTERPSRALLAATPSILSETGGAPPEIAALNAQLAQIKALRAGALYGPGLTHIVRAPIPGLRSALGEEWRELAGAIGRAYLRPSGDRSRYFEASLVVVAHAGPARLVVLTSEGQRLVEPVGASPFQVVNVGPLLAPAHGGVGVALSTLKPSHEATGPNLIISPVQSEYLQPGDWVAGLPALAEVGPGGARGIYLTGDKVTRFAMTPTVAGPVYVTIRGAGLGHAVPITVTLGGQSRSAAVAVSPGVTRVGPFERADSALSLATAAPRASAKTTPVLFVSDIRLLSR